MGPTGSGRTGRCGCPQRAVGAGLRAQLEVDLPRALAEVFCEHHRGRCDDVRMRADHFLLSPAVREAAAVREVSPWHARWVPARLRSRDVFDIARARREAFDRGGAEVVAAS